MWMDDMLKYKLLSVINMIYDLSRCYALECNDLSIHHLRGKLFIETLWAYGLGNYKW